MFVFHTLVPAAMFRLGNTFWRADRRTNLILSTISAYIIDSELVKDISVLPSMYTTQQVFLVLRLDRDIDWSWLKVMSPLLAWASLRMFGYVYKVWYT